MARRAAKAASKAAGIDIDYTIPGLIVLVLIVLLTGLFFAQPNIAQQAHDVGGAQTIGGKAIDTGSGVVSNAPICEKARLCDGSRLIIRNSDCTEFSAYCNYGCGYPASVAQCL